MGTYFPMSSHEGEAETMIYLRETFPSSQTEASLLPTDMIPYMNCPSSSVPNSGGFVEHSENQTGCSNLASGSRSGQSHLSTWGGAIAAPSVLQGLSLTLGPHAMQIPAIRYSGPNEHSDIASILSSSALPCPEESEKNIPFENKQYSSYGASNIARAVPNSKYLKAAQHLLDEVVSVKDADVKSAQKEAENAAPDSDPSTALAPGKQELESRLIKLLAMVDEVDRRYRQYYNQMQMLVSSFDAIAGSGAATPYTYLALRTISRHFRSLRDAVNRQIQAARKGLREEDGSDRGVGISRLRYVDRQIRQQRALQQIGMVQQQAWRPQRGLTETSVSVLRSWLFEHFLHPYPKDSDKAMIARQTGLTRFQVSNWFINARVRLWKPMVEEMYREELGDVDVDSNSSSETSTPPGIREKAAPPLLRRRNQKMTSVD